MGLFIFIGFFIGFALSFRFVRRPRIALIWGLVLGGLPLAFLLGPLNAPIQGIGSVLYFAVFALGPIMLVLFVAIGAAFGMAGASVAMWVGQERASWIGWTTGLAILGLITSLTLWPVAKREIAKRQLAEDREMRTEAITRADFKGTLAGHQVTFPATPRLHVFDNCAPGIQAGLFGCSTSFTNPVSIFTKPDEVLLHERSDLIIFRTISISATEHECRLGNDSCLTQKKIDRWCRETRPDQAGSIWCRDAPEMQFVLRADATPGPSDRDEPELTARYADTVLGPGRVTCFYSPDKTETHRQGTSCRLSFDLVSGVKVTLGARREQITSDDQALTATIALIPDYWATLTVER